MSKTREWLEGRRQEVLQGLVDEPARETRAALKDELQEIEAALHAIRPKSGWLSACRRPIDAVVLYLDKRDRAATKEEIIAGVTAGGFGGGGADQKNPISWSMSVHLNGKAKRKNIIRQHNGLIGRGAWPDEKFRSGATLR